MISFADRAVVPANVLIRFLEQESVLLNLNTERYFGLDPVGTRMWQLLTSAPSVEAAFLKLSDEFDVDSHTLRANLSDLISHLVENGLITLQPADVGTTPAV
ncbi:MAG TPA: PqqD family protein [Dongiaceae bacterium]|nr:PqqD family protein [Dongiaceae bacterium]